MPSKLQSKISNVLKRTVFSSKEANQLGISSSLLAYYCKIGRLERISRGLYKTANKKLSVSIEWEDVALTAKSIPKGVICLITALTYYELTDQFAREIWIAVSRESAVPKRLHTRIIRTSNMKLGLEKIKLGEISIKIFNRERTIVDSFRHLTKEIAIKALKIYLKGDKERRPDLKKLSKYAKEMRVDISPYIETIIT